MAEHSQVATHLAELYSSIHQHQADIDNLTADYNKNLAEVNGKLDKAKKDFAAYLKDAGIDKLIAPQQSSLFTAADVTGLATGTAPQRKPRTSSADKAASVERNKTIYVGEYPNGIDERTGLPKRFKGRGEKNAAIDAQMKDDERDYEAKQNGGSQDAPNQLEGAMSETAEAPKSASKKKASAAH